ncbi:WD40 repeat-like protein, partial [Dichomitus squalens LYAD-421 SS1]
GHDASVTSLVVSSDGRWVATASDDSTIILWGARDACISQEWIAHDGQVRDLAFSPDSRYIASAGEDRKVAIWDISGSAHQPLFWQAHENVPIRCVVFSPDGRLLLSTGDNAVKIWDADTGATVQSLEGHEGRVTGACFSPCGKYIASGSNDKTVRVWRTSDGACLTTLSDHGHWVSHVAFTPDGTMLWSAAGNGTVLGRRLQDVLPDEFVED